MNRSIHNVPRFPTKGGLTLDTPHLIATVNLGNACATLGTRLGFLANEANGREIVFFTFVSFFLDQQASRTGILFTEPALVFGRKISFTLFGLAIHEEFVFFFDDIVSHRESTFLNLLVVPNGLTLVAAVFDTDTLDRGAFSCMYGMTFQAMGLLTITTLMRLVQWIVFTFHTHERTKHDIGIRNFMI
jgi:hypothetical protein